MATFSPTITNVSSSPALVVTVADPGVPGVTYNQLKNSLGQYVYLLQGFYLQATTLPQLIGAIKYLRYDADGNQVVTNITTTVDPYQDQNSIIVDLANFETDVIFNGNSSVQATILGNEQLTLKLYTRRITASFGRNLTNYLVQEKIANKPDFFNNYGNLFRIAQDNFLAQQSAVLGASTSEIHQHRRQVAESGEEVTIPVQANKGVPVQVQPVDASTFANADGNSKIVVKKEIVPETNYGLVFLVVAGASFLGYVSQKRK